VSALHPTPTRLALLAAIKAREVTGYPTYDCGHVDYFWDFTVTARVNELIRAGWVPEYEPGPGGRTPDFKVKLTEARREGTGRRPGVGRLYPRRVPGGGPWRLPRDWHRVR
jgi:hypothetical protein